MTRPQQAVILCGGLGTRLRPLTDTRPKPMAPINGRPFLEYLIEQLREQGISRVLLLTGYRGEMIQEYFGHGEGFGLRIDYSHGPVDWSTGRRVWEAQERCDERFLLLYSDNFTPFSLDKLLAFHGAGKAVLSLLLQPKAKGNVSVAADGLVDCYDSSRAGPQLDHVEIGYMMVERDAMFSFFELPDDAFSTILQRLAANRKLAGLVCGDAYHSISDLHRWQLTEKYLTPKRILLIDRDGTINQRPPRGEYVTSWAQFIWIADTLQAMSQLANAGFSFIILSNQAGVARGQISAQALAAINSRMVGELAREGIVVLDAYVCPHHWDAGCACRKPAPGMFFQASRDHLIRLDRTVYVGDDPRDCVAAHRAGCLSVQVGPEHDLAPDTGDRPEFAAAGLSAAVPWILERYFAWSATPSAGPSATTTRQAAKEEG